MRDRVLSLLPLKSAIGWAAPSAILVGASHEYGFATTVFGRFISIYDGSDLLRIAIEFLAISFWIPVLFLVLEWTTRRFDVGITRAAFDSTYYATFVVFAYVLMLVWSFGHFYSHPEIVRVASNMSGYVVVMAIISCFLRPLFVESQVSLLSGVILAIWFSFSLGANSARQELLDNRMTNVVQTGGGTQYGRILRVLNKGVIFRNSNGEMIFFSWGEIKSFKTNAVRRAT